MREKREFLVFGIELKEKAAQKEKKKGIKKGWKWVLSCEGSSFFSSRSCRKKRGKKRKYKKKKDRGRR